MTPKIGEVCNVDGDILIDEDLTAKLGFIRVNKDQVNRAEMYGWVKVGDVIGTDYAMVQRQRGWFRRMVQEMNDAG